MNWLRQLLSGKPHFVIGSADRPYMLRWWLIPRNPFLCVYLHKFLRDDDDRALHDHPWWFVSVILSGGYGEITDKTIIPRGPFSVAFRRAEHRHRVVLLRDERGQPKPCWTLVIRGRVVREWGFWCPKGFVHWKQFVAPHNKGEVGRGCE
jgi:hypothetical protein